MSLRIKLITSFWFFLAFLAFPQTINNISFEGNIIFSQSELLLWSGLEGSRYDPAIEDTAKSRLAAQLSSRGYFYSEVTETSAAYVNDSSNINLKFNISEGPPTYIQEFNIKGKDSIICSRLMLAIDYLRGQIYNKFEIEETISSFLSLLENEAYPFARIVINSVYLSANNPDGEHMANITITIDEGIESKIDKVVIEGNTITNDNVILRELRLVPGEKYSHKLVEDLPERLNRLRFFEPVAIPDYFIDSQNEGVLFIKVKEKQTNNFDGIIGYIPPASANEKGYVSGLVNVSLRNLFGTGRAAGIHWQQLNRTSQELELKYLEPWLFSFPFNLSGRLFQRKQDTTYVQRNVEGSVEYLATENISASVFISTEQVIPAERTNSVFTVFNSSSLTTGVNLTIDTRDDPYAPLGGILFSNSYSFSRKKINGPQDFFYEGLERNLNLQRIELDLSGFHQLFKAQVIAAGVHARELRGSFLEISDLYKLGGTRSLRGYREEQFAGSRIFWSNIEYRLLLTRRSFAFLFFDTGYYFRNAEPERNIPKLEDFNIGYGLGLNIETGLGILGVSFALAGGNSFSDGVIHFGLINEF